MPALSEEAPFRPRRGRAIAGVAAAASLVIFTGLALALPGPDRGGQWGPVDKGMVFALGAGIALLLACYVRIGAWPGREGLKVRNLVLTRTIAWDEIEEVRFGGGEPWVTLELTDGDSAPVMAVQRADGPFAQEQAQRLLALIARRSGPGAGPGAV